MPRKLGKPVSSSARPRKRISRSLRFRLTASYALFFTLLLSILGWMVRNNLETSQDAQIRDSLEQEWAAVKGYLRIENDVPRWFADRADPDEAFIVGRLQHVYLLADAQGVVRQASEVYRSLGMDSAASIRKAIQSTHAPVWREARDSKHVPYLIRGGVVFDERHEKMYYVAIGQSLAENRAVLNNFTWLCIGLIPLMILGGCLLGWILAGRALTPVLEVAQTAQNISGSNLSLRIPTRQAGDELDYLIETFNQMIERLENSFRQIRRFSTDVSHELRTPITIIRGQLEVALFTAQTSEQYREAILESLQDIERLSQIVRALLLLSQAETGQVVLQKEDLDLCAVVRDIVDQFQIPAEGAHIRVLLSPVEGPCHLQADRVQIERMLSNLLSNTLKFTPAGGEVRVGIMRREDEVDLTIEDTGCGIPAEHLPHIFDRFYRVDGPDTQASPEKGLGLGLSFVAWIVKAHDGTVEVESQPGKGTKFTITLPVHTPQHTPAEPDPTMVSA